MLLLFLFYHNIIIFINIICSRLHVLKKITNIKILFFAMEYQTLFRNVPYYMRILKNKRKTMQNGCKSLTSPIHQRINLISFYCTSFRLYYIAYLGSDQFIIDHKLEFTHVVNLFQLFRVYPFSNFPIYGNKWIIRTVFAGSSCRYIVISYTYICIKHKFYLSSSNALYTFLCLSINGLHFFLTSRELPQLLSFEIWIWSLI